MRVLIIKKRIRSIIKCKNNYNHDARVEDGSFEN